MNCKYCGASLKDGAKFCTGCGQTVKTADVQPMGYGQNPYGQTPYVQNPVPHNPAPQNQFSVPMQPPTGRYYPNQPRQTGGAAGIKMFFVFFMIYSLLMSAVGLMRLPLIASSEMETLFEMTNMDAVGELWNVADGKIGKMFEAVFDDFDAEPLFRIGFLITVAAFFAVIIVSVLALICCLGGSYSGAASMTGLGFLILALGFLGSILESIKLHSEMSDYYDNIRIGLMPPVMVVVCVAMGFFAFISSRKMKNAA